ncbi:ATP-binding protein [Streptomyces griseus]|uniref:ATP-binding protein n=1 Tax=Streptomyces griseus TaxID=1911 RepID=UPI00068F78AE|nr:ATP-binding protein [Streptomyces griseus]
MRYELFTALDLAGEPPRHPSEFDRLLKTAPAERPRTFLVDEAQWLNGEAFEYFRYLWDEPSTQLAIIFVGAARAATPCCAAVPCRLSP